MKKILFVDEENKVLDSLRRMLWCHRRAWQMEFMCSGKQALQRLTESRFDVLVTNTRLLDMDCTSLLTEVKQRFPHTVRIVLSGEARQDVLLKVIRVAHQYVPMPCDAETLRQIIVHAGAADDRLGGSPLGKLVAQVDSLPSIPVLHEQLVSELDSPDASGA